MTSIYLVRHGQSEGNISGRLQGQTDTALTPLGQLQAEHVGRRFMALPLAAVYASPLQRARQTAAHIAAHHGLEVQVEPDVVEMRLGIFENRLAKEIAEEYPEDFVNFDKSPHLFKGVEGSETILEVYTRMVAAIGRIADRHPDETVAVVSHGCAIRSYLCFARAFPLERMGETDWGRNTGVSHVVYNGGVVTLHRVNDISHLPDEALGGGGKI